MPMADPAFIILSALDVANERSPIWLWGFTHFMPLAIERGTANARGGVGTGRLLRLHIGRQRPGASHPDR